MEHHSVFHKHIENLAYELWQERGEPMGSPDEDWLRAEHMLHAEGSAHEPPVELSTFAFAMGPSEE
jgi:hypothetical protein